MKIIDAFEQSCENLKANKIENYKSSCFILFCKVLKKDKAWLFAHFDDEMGQSYLNEIEAGIKKLSKNMPAHYVTEEKEFMSLLFHVEPSVLIPRCETELLTEKIIAYCKKNNMNAPDILELGTGSGCICVSLAYNIRNANIISADISQDALETAKKNVEKYKLGNRVTLLNKDMLKRETYLETSKLTRGNKFDIILSNPPYIISGDICNLEPGVREYEPLIALDGGDDGLKFYKAIAKNSSEVLKQDGHIFLEAGFDTAKPAAEIFENFGFKTAIIKDYEDNDRLIICEKNSGNRF